ncbi:MAG: class I SAM-dependent methyltransferase [Marivibrio sp.]|uniref:class I SAM-dependent methyltransferase n=1 Tax=Marivibrio sp. TaxID=2039719 RepID=UPI0032EEE085
MTPPPFLRPPILRALLALGGSALATLGFVQALWRLAGSDPPLWTKLLFAGAVAVAIGAALSLPRWWLAILASAPAALIGALALDAPGWVYALALTLCLLLAANSPGERVPLYLTGAATRRALCGLIAQDAPVRAVDLGCGTGGPILALAAANRHPQSRFLGVETAPLPFAAAWLRAKAARDPRISICWRSLWRVDLGGFDLVYAFLSPEPMPRLLAKAAAEMTDGALFVSNEFTDPAYVADQQLTPNGPAGRRLNLWRAPIRPVAAN